MNREEELIDHVCRAFTKREVSKLNKRKVYVVNYAEQDMSSAERFGELIYLTEGKGVNIFSTDSLLSEIKPKLRDFEESDFLLLSGHPVLNIIASALIWFKYGRVNVLIFDAKTRDYQPQTITENQLSLGDSDA